MVPILTDRFYALYGACSLNEPLAKCVDEDDENYCWNEKPNVNGDHDGHNSQTLEQGLKKSPQRTSA